MNILSLNISDLGGLSYNLCQAINELTSHHAVNLVAIRPFTKKPVMIHYGRKMNLELRRKLRRWVANADVLHINEKWSCVARYGVRPQECRGKKVIYHAHGSIFRRRSGWLLRKFRGAFPQLKIITSTPDLLAYAPKASWFPSIVPIGKYRRDYRIQRNTPPIVYYSPSGSSTEEMKRVIGRVLRELRRERLRVNLKMTTGVTHKSNMTRKAKADIYYDEIAPSPFYGVNAIEAAVFEMAVICNMNAYARRYMRQHGYQCPFLRARSKADLKRVLRKLVNNSAYRQKSGKASYKYAVKFHARPKCIKRFLALVK